MQEPALFLWEIITAYCTSQVQKWNDLLYHFACLIYIFLYLIMPIVHRLDIEDPTKMVFWISFVMSLSRSYTAGYLNLFFNCDSLDILRGSKLSSIMPAVWMWNIKLLLQWKIKYLAQFYLFSQQWLASVYSLMCVWGGETERERVDNNSKCKSENILWI